MNSLPVNTLAMNILPMTKLPKQILTPLLTGNSVSEKRAELKQYFLNSWQSYGSLFALLNADQAYYLRPEPLRHPLIFYFGHTATFFINKLILGKYIPQRINEKLEAVCAVGVDEMSWDDLNSEHYDWPTVEEVKAYRQQVFDVVITLIDNMEITLPIKQDSLAWVILMGCEHERIHLETSSVLMRLLDLCYITANEYWKSCDESAAALTNTFLPVTGKQLILGKPDTAATFGWDNEYGYAHVEVKDFAAAKYLTSNQEYLAFVEDGGYKKPALWTEEGQQWLAFTQAKMPRFWRKGLSSSSEGVATGHYFQHNYFQRNLVDEIPLPLNWPVEVNYLEAKAYCHWLGEKQQYLIRLPTEAEWLVLYQQSEVNAFDLANNANINLADFASSCPNNRFEHQGFFDVIGNVWQWSESTIDGFNHFKVHVLYDDFSTPTFDGRHNLIKGGSWISTGNETIKHSRYAFRRHFTQHAGFRTVKSNQSTLPLVESSPYETAVDLCQQLESNYGANDNGGVKNYQQQLAELVVNFSHQCQALSNTSNISQESKLLNIGCGIGRCAFELALSFNHIDAVDFSAANLQHAVSLQQGKNIKYTFENQGDIVDYNEVSLTDISLEKEAEKVRFSQGDISNLKTIFTGYNVIFIQHALEQSYDPLTFLKNVHQRLAPSGLLMIATDYYFDEKITDKNNWLSGIKVNGENVLGLDGLMLPLSKHFTLVAQQNIERVVRINRRKKQLTSIELSVWQLK